MNNLVIKEIIIVIITISMKIEIIDKIYNYSIIIIITIM